VGRYLLLRGVVAVLCDGEGPIPAPEIFRRAILEEPADKAGDRPRLNDLAYTEAVLFGA
jgi:hypothetical protein